MPGLSRREALVAPAAAVLWRHRAPPATATVSGPSWPFLGYDTHNTCFAPEAAVPRDAIRRRWSNSAGSFSVPVADGSRAYVTTSYPNEARAIELESGRREWRIDLPEDAPVLAPALAHGRVYVAGRTLRALDSETGDQQWEQAVPALGPPTVHSETVFVRTAELLVAVDAADGAVQWRYEVPMLTRINEITPIDRQSAPATDGETVYVVEGRDVEAEDGSEELDPARLHAVDAATGDRKWVRDIESAWYAEPVLGDGTVYVRSRSSVAGFDASDGTERWTLDLGMETVCPSPPPLADEGLYVPLEDDGWAIAVLGADGSVRRRLRTNADLEGTGSLTVAGDTLLISISYDGLYALDRTSGERLWRVEYVPNMSGYQAAGVAVVDGTVLAGDADLNAITAGDRTSVTVGDPYTSDAKRTLMPLLLVLVPVIVTVFLIFAVFSRLGDEYNIDWPG